MAPSGTLSVRAVYEQEASYTRPQAGREREHGHGHGNTGTRTREHGNTGTREHGDTGTRTRRHGDTDFTLLPGLNGQNRHLQGTEKRLPHVYRVYRMFYVLHRLHCFLRFMTPFTHF